MFNPSPLQNVALTLFNIALFIGLVLFAKFAYKLKRQHERENMKDAVRERRSIEAELDAEQR